MLLAFSQPVALTLNSRMRSLSWLRYRQTSWHRRTRRPAEARNYCGRKAISVEAPRQKPKTARHYPFRLDSRRQIDRYLHCCTVPSLLRGQPEESTMALPERAGPSSAIQAVSNYILGFTSSGTTSSESFSVRRITDRTDEWPTRSSVSNLCKSSMPEIG